VVEIFTEQSGNRNNDNPRDENNRIGFRARNLTTDGTERTDKKGQADIASFSYPCSPCYPWLKFFAEPSGNRNNDNPRDENNRIGFRARNLTTDGTESTDKKGQADIASFSYPCSPCYPWLKFSRSSPATGTTTTRWMRTTTSGFVPGI
jgi:ribosomal protein L34